MSDRFSRMRILYGEEACFKLASSRVLVCGLGAVGGFALEILARSGIGSFYIADADTFDETNINRQLGALSSTVGKRKTEVWRDRILDVNPSAKAEIFDSFIDASTVPALLDLKPDLIIDAIDTIASKILLMKEAFLRDIKLVSSMGAARRTDVTKVKAAPLAKTACCPVAFRIRKELRREDIKANYACVYSQEVASDGSHVSGGSGNSKKIIGSSPAVTGIFGIMLADLGIKELLRDVKR